MRDVCTRVIQVRFASDLDPHQPRLQSEQTRFAAAVLFPPEVKRQLATLEVATARAVGLAREIVQRGCYRPPDLGAVEVTTFDVSPFREVAWTQEDGTQVFLTEVEQPLPHGWARRRLGSGKK